MNRRDAYQRRVLQLRHLLDTDPPISIAGYLEAGLGAVENYSPKDELAQLSLIVKDAIKVLRARAEGQQALGNSATIGVLDSDGKHYVVTVLGSKEALHVLTAMTRGYEKGVEDQRQRDLVAVETVKTSDDSPDPFNDYANGYLNACDEITRRLASKLPEKPK